MLLSCLITQSHRIGVASILVNSGSPLIVYQDCAPERSCIECNSRSRTGVQHAERALALVTRFSAFLATYQPITLSRLFRPPIRRSPYVSPSLSPFSFAFFFSFFLSFFLFFFFLIVYPRMIESGQCFRP